MPDWRRFHGSFSRQMNDQEIGTPIPLKDFRIEYLDAEDFGQLLNQRHSKIAHKNPNDRKKVHAIARKLQTDLGDHLVMLRHTTADYGIKEEDFSDKQHYGRAAAFIVDDALAPLTAVDIGLTVQDMYGNLEKERQMVIEILGSRDFGFNISGLSAKRWIPTIPIGERHQPLNEIVNDELILEYPLYIPFGNLALQMTTQRA